VAVTRRSIPEEGRGGSELASELHAMRDRLAQQARAAAQKERQLERYAADLRETFKAERARAEELRRSYIATVRALATAVEARDAYTGKHAERVAAYALELLAIVEPKRSSDPQSEFGFLLHDVGKVAVPDAILHKAGALDDAEMEQIRRHPELGAQILAGIDFLAGAALDVVRHHHERWDGNGYPDGLAGADIPLVARVFAVADTLDAITTTRPYRAAQPLSVARERITAGAGSQFDPRVVEALATVEDAVLERIRNEIG
jgi:ribonuclease P protein subunit RPR2